MRDRGALAMLLGAVAIAIVAWALLIPPFAVPDEAEHFGYAQSLAENGERPPPLRPGIPPLSSEGRFARRVARTTSLLAERIHKPAWEPHARDIWDGGEGRFPRDDIRALGPQRGHPPLYYAYEVPPYAAASESDVFDRLFLMRLWSGALMLVTACGAWLLVGELTGRDRLLQLAGATCVGLQPMATFVSAGVNPDSLLFASFSVALWLAARLLRRGPDRLALAGLVGATATAVLTKAAGLALVPGVTLVLFLLARRAGHRRLALGALALGAAVAATGLLFARDLGDRVYVEGGPRAVLGFATYLWDFYLPRLPFQHEYASLHLDNPAWALWVKQTWAAFGFLEIKFPPLVYWLFAGAAVAAFAGAALAIRRARFALPPGLPWVFAAVTLSLVAGIHWVDFRSVNDADTRVIQGRYLLPLMPIVGVAVAAALTSLRPRARVLAAAAVLSGMAALQLLSLALVSGRYFA